jgi:hypothetical protein
VAAVAEEPKHQVAALVIQMEDLLQPVAHLALVEQVATAGMLAVAAVVEVGMAVAVEDRTTTVAARMVAVEVVDPPMPEATSR